jgi:hypothetical protein
MKEQLSRIRKIPIREQDFFVVFLLFYGPYSDNFIGRFRILPNLRMQKTDGKVRMMCVRCVKIVELET